jgi:hypothetical protein
MKKILLAVVFIICFSGLANAQSAWVLWLRSIPNMSDYGGHDWSIQEAFPKYEQCLEKEKLEYSEWEKLSQNLGTDWSCFNHYPYFIYCKKVKEGKTIDLYQYEWKCLPATVDPRK